MPKTYHIFLSYSRTDGDMMRRMTADLRRDGFTVWNDDSLEPGTPSWKSAIEEAIESSQVVVALLSPDAKKSEWIERELDYARAQSLRIIPVIVRGDTQNAVPFELISVQRADVRKDYKAGYQNLRAALCDLLNLPQLCPEPKQPAAVTKPISAMQPTAAPHALPGQQVQIQGKLRFWNPFDYARFIYLYLFNPERLHTFDYAANRTVAVWLVSALLWLPLALNVLTYRLHDIPLWGIGEQAVFILPSWFVALGWLATGIIGQIRFDVRAGLWAFLRGPLRIVAVAAGLAAALMYAGSVFPVLPPLEIRDGLVYLLQSSAQQWLIIAGSLSVFVAAILAHTMAQGFSRWLSFFMAAGFVGLIALALYIPIGERLAPALPDATASSDVTANGIMVYAGVTCCLGIILWIAGAVTGGAIRQRQVSGFNFLMLVMLVAAYGLFIWVHLLGGG